MIKKGLYILTIVIAVAILSYFGFNYFNSTKVFFDSNGGSSVSAIKVSKNTVLGSIPTPTKTGYKFLYWMYDGKAYDLNTKVTSNMKLTAVWEATEETSIAKYEIIFDTDSDLKIESQTIEKDNLVLKPTNPIKDGYIFIEWQLDGKAYDFNTKVQKSFTLKAVYESAKTYKVTFNTNGGTTIGVVAVKENKVVLKPTNPAKEGYTFIEWQLNGKGYDFNTKVTSDFILEAVYERSSLVLDGTIYLSSSLISELGNVKTIELNYTKIENAAKYEIYRKQAGDTTYTLYTTASTLDYVLEINLGFDYSYKVRGILEENGKTYYSEFSNVISQKNLFTIPTLSKMFAGVNGSTYLPGYNLSVDSLNGASGIEVYYSTSIDSNFTLLKKISAKDCLVEIPTGYKYYYKIRLYKIYPDKTVYSDYSNIIEISNEIYPPTLTSQFLGVNSESRNYLLSIDNLYNATGVEIYYKNGEYDEYKLLTVTPYKEFSAILTNGKPYTYRARLYLRNDTETVYSPYSTEITILP